ncbi:hypothetical protein [sulfur-oxidizing endosymbiont of Gigantopelta aegis]|uniref:hypothetical protein n=1 Tax=sulfur-oxidizing endosymbiont of Gigantopelta aegis TaxID=2794934 RepID=UPI0018DC8A71|nr:hypothetical protein [sulfur-oxidizing endosymbiont of Gigantopelta aegis]
MKSITKKNAWDAKRRTHDFGVRVKNMLQNTSIIILLFLIASCTNPLNVMIADRYYNDGMNLANQSKWNEAKIAYGRALANVE